LFLVSRKHSYCLSIHSIFVFDILYIVLPIMPLLASSTVRKPPAPPQLVHCLKCILYPSRLKPLIISPAPLHCRQHSNVAQLLSDPISKDNRLISGGKRVAFSGSNSRTKVIKANRAAKLFGARTFARKVKPSVANHTLNGVRASSSANDWAMLMSV